MKKFAVTFLLTIFVFNLFYPAIYAMEENQVENETKEVVKQEENVENTLNEVTTLENTEKTEEIVEPKEEIQDETKEKQEEMAEEKPEVMENSVQTEEPVKDATENAVEPEDITVTEPIDESQTQVGDSLKIFAGKMFLDTPAQNQVIMGDNSSNFKVSGWAVSNDRNSTLRIYVNGNYVKNINTRTARPDVDLAVSPEFGGMSNTPKSGFETELDLSHYPEGTYQIIVYQVASNETIISSDTKTVQVKPTRHVGQMYLETPANMQTYTLPNINSIKLQGWAVSNDSQATVRLYVNGNYVKNISTRTARPDVDGTVSGGFGGTANTPKAGFETDLDLSHYTEGNYQITVYQVARNEMVISSDTKTIQIKTAQYAGTMCVETGNNVSKTLPQEAKLQLSGWAVSNDIYHYIVANIDGKDCTYQVARNTRGDVDSTVSVAYGGTSTTPQSGFSMEIDISHLAEGGHLVKICEVSRFGQILATQQINLNITTPNYKGDMNIEAPIHNKRYRSGILEVEGWVMSEATNGDYVCVYVNGAYQKMAERVERPDVIAVLNGQHGGAAKNPYPGFKTTIDASHYGEGVYKLKVVHFSKYGKVIQTKEINFIISNTTTWGIDVSHHQGAINWNAVKGSGVNFAILKIGEYRESSGRIIKDAHFEEYYRECKRLGIAVGGYFYSYAFNSTEAAHEADACSQLISGKSFEMPIFFDIEDKLVTNEINSGRTNRNEITNAAITFCDILNSRGYKSGVYSYRNFFYSCMNMAQLEKYNIWLAHYVANTDYTGKYDMWQYRDDGTVPGISGAVDLNWCFKRYY